MDLKELAKEYFDNVKLMQLATINKNGPWICSVFFAADDNFNIYWTSGRDRQHSREILEDGRVAITIVLDDVNKRALQIVGNAKEVADSDLERVHKLYQSKFGQKDYDLEEMKQRKPAGRAYWVFEPTQISFWDEQTFPDKPKQSFKTITELT